MRRPLDLFEQVADVVEGEARPKGSKVPGVHDKRRPICSRRRGDQPPTQRFVHHIPKRAARAPSLRPELRRHVVVERQGRSHIMML